MDAMWAADRVDWGSLNAAQQAAIVVTILGTGLIAYRLLSRGWPAGVVAIAIAALIVGGIGVMTVVGS